MPSTGSSLKIMGRYPSLLTTSITQLAFSAHARQWYGPPTGARGEGVLEG
jgi:hypothetical protein